MGKKIDEVLEVLESNYNSMQRVVMLERIDLDRRLEEAKKRDSFEDYEGIAKLCYRIARHMQNKEAFEYSMHVVKNKAKKFEG